jgi:para-aminobenzoate synthetase / 4-amino-4-deoxychorismate lyase
VPVSHHPDPSKGVFETMLVLDGRPVELEAHLERLATSLAALYGAELPSTARDAVIDRGRDVRHGKLRLTVVPGPRGRLKTRITTGEVEVAAVFPAAERGVALRSFVVENGLGEHKWADRRLLERAAANAPDELPLVLDGAGAALEASRGSLFSAGGGRLATPPTDGRILPSIARRQAIAIARAEGIETHEQRLTLGDLRRGGEVFLVGSVRGVEPVRSLDGIDLPLPGEISARIAAGLRRRWLQVPQGESVEAVAGGQRGGRPAR